MRSSHVCTCTHVCMYVYDYAVFSFSFLCNYFLYSFIFPALLLGFFYFHIFSFNFLITYIPFTFLFSISFQICSCPHDTLSICMTYTYMHILMYICHVYMYIYIYNFKLCFHLWGKYAFFFLSMAYFAFHSDFHFHLFF